MKHWIKVLLLIGLIPAVVQADRPEGEVVTFYLTDHLGTPVVAMDEEGEVLWTREYSAFGEALENGDEVQVGYTGHEFVPESGLSYMEARWYNPVIGRFLQPDPVGFTDSNTLSFNRYLYVNNSPYVAQDPDGEYLDAIIEVASISIGIASAIENFSQGNIKEGLMDVAFAAADGVLMAVPGIPGGMGAARYAAKNADNIVGDVAKGAGNAAKKSDDVIHVTKDGVAIRADPKYKIPDNYVQNPHRSGNYGEIVDGKYKERLRIDPATPPGQKGPNYSHYHKNGKGEHYSPKEGDPDPGF